MALVAMVGMAGCAGVKPCDCDVIRYVCDDGNIITADFEEQSARISFYRGTFELPQVPAASGTKFSNGEIMFWAKGQDNALLEMHGQAFLSGCKRQEKKLDEDEGPGY